MTGLDDLEVDMLVRVLSGGRQSAVICGSAMNLRHSSISSIEFGSKETPAPAAAMMKRKAEESKIRGGRR